jgi:hypothetical protein
MAKICRNPPETLYFVTKLILKVPKERQPTFGQAITSGPFSRLSSKLLELAIAQAMLDHYLMISSLDQEFRIRSGKILCLR